MTIFYIFISLLSVVLIIIAVLRRSYNIEHVVIIRNVLEDVRDKVSDLNYFALWSPYKLKDDAADIKINGTAGMAGHTCTWKGQKAGSGYISIRAIDEKHVHFDLVSSKLLKIESNDNWFFEEWGDSETKVTWQKNGWLSFPFARFTGPMVIKQLHREIRNGLASLKVLCEGST